MLTLLQVSKPEDSESAAWEEEFSGGIVARGIEEGGEQEEEGGEGKDVEGGDEVIWEIW